MMRSGYTSAAIGYRLSDQQAKDYANQLTQTRLFRVTVFPIGFGASTIELRPLPGLPWKPTRTLRTTADCEAALAELRPIASAKPATEPTSGATE